MDIASEALWPSRCVLCDKPGTVLCAECQRALPFIDSLLACPRCGAAFGRVQCTECNSTMLAPFGYTRPPYDQAASPLILTEAVRRIVVTYKDRGGRGLARPMAELMKRYLFPAWLERRPLITFVPATNAARRRRGFDHAELLARELSWMAGTEFSPALAVPNRRDQRELARAGRIGNMRKSLHTLAGASIAGDVILVDDVCTTGATLFAASEALKAAGAARVFCLTFARA